MHSFFQPNSVTVTTSSMPTKVTVVTIPSMPTEVNFAHLSDDLKLLNKEQRAHAKQLISAELNKAKLAKLKGRTYYPKTYYPKTETVPYDVIYKNNQMWVVSEVVASGAHGEVKNIQNDKTGVFCIYKDTDESMDREHHILNQLGLSHSPLMRRSLVLDSPTITPTATPPDSPKSRRQASPVDSPTSSPLQKVRHGVQVLFPSKFRKKSNSRSPKKSNSWSPIDEKQREVRQLFGDESLDHEDSDQGIELEETKIKSGLIMEFAPGVSAQAIFGAEFGDNNQFEMSFYPPALRMQFLISIVEELSKLHQKNIIHRDLALGNVILDWVGQRVRLVDYGLSVKLENGVFRGALKGSSITYPSEFRDEFARILTERQKGNSGAPFTQLEYSKLTDVAEVSVLLSVIAQLIEFPDMDNQLSWGDKNFIVDKNHKYCQNSLCFPREVTEVLVDLLHALFDKDLSKRAQAWGVAKSQLENIRDTCLANEKLPVVAIIDFSEFQQADGSAKGKLIGQLEDDGIREVWLIDSDPKSHTLKQYAEMQKDLENDFTIYVNSNVYTGPCDIAKAALEADLAKRPVKSEIREFSPHMAPKIR